jgi:HAD superfamily hydrolase (TIGR01549 family)
MTRGLNIPDSLSTVLFDLDDTLLDSWNARVYALQSVFSHANISNHDAELFLQKSLGTPLNEALNQLAVQQDLDSDSLFKYYRHCYWTKKPGLISLYRGVKEMLEKLHSLGIKLGIVTLKARFLEVEGRRAGTVRELEELGVDHLFSVIVGFEDVKHFKPHPEGIYLALNHLASQPHETLVVGDSASDIAAATAANCRSCYATWGIRDLEKRLNEITADLVVERPEQLSRLSFQPSR